MRMRVRLGIALAALCLPGLADARGSVSDADSVSVGQAAPPMPKPGPEHAIFKEDAGTWDATVEIFAAPGQPPMTSKAVETSTIGCGGLCLITDFKGEMMPGQAFHGHGTAAYDPAKKKVRRQLDRLDVHGADDRRSPRGMRRARP